MSVASINNAAPKLIVVGGRHRRSIVRDLEEGNRYEKALIVEVDTIAQSARVVFEYESDPSLCPNRSPSFVFKAGTLVGNRLTVCTLTEILEISTTSWSVVRSVSHPWFNDVHHVLPLDDDRLMVASTGLNMVVEIDWDSQLLQHWIVGPQCPWERFSKETDFRKLPSTKPHDAHPNFVFIRDKKRWVTRFHYQDAVCIDASGLSIPIQAGNPHDGVPFNDNKTYFTTTNGHIVCVGDSAEKMTTWDLNDSAPSKIALGWCRGLCPILDGYSWVGFSRIRRTLIKKNLNWVRNFTNRGNKPINSGPTRLTLFELDSRKVLSEINLETVGMNSVFGIYRGSIP